MTRYLDLAEYLWLAEQVTGVEGSVLAKASRVDPVRTRDGRDDESVQVVEHRAGEQFAERAGVPFPAERRARRYRWRSRV